MNWNLANTTSIPVYEPSRRLYFFDESLPDSARNIHHVYPRVAKHGVVFESASDSFLKNVSGFCGSIVGLDDRRYRLYYTTSGEGAMRIGVAESDDGVSWERLTLEQESRNSFDSNLIVFDGVPSEEIVADGEVVAADGRKISTAARRNRQDQVGQPQVVRLPDGSWRMYYWHHQHGWGRIPYLYTIAESQDGLVWRAPRFDRPALNAHWLGDQTGLDESVKRAEKGRRTNDATFVYYNERLGCYEQFSQWFLDTHPDRRVQEDNCPDFNRMIQRRTSSDGWNWSAPELVVQADNRDPWDQQFYHLAVQYHEDWYIGSLGHYRVEDKQQTLDLELIFSRDGRNWERPMRSGFIQREHGGRDAEGITPPNAWLDRGDDWLCLYTATARKHNRHADVTLPATCLMAASWSKHRFVGLGANAQPGGFLTPVFYMQGSELVVDADVKGWLRSELCDAWGRKIDNFQLNQSIPVTGDKPDHVLRWESDEPSRYIHDPVRLRFEFADATVYSLRF